ncbi:MAG: cell division FtsA domain-containing protein [Clostridia bacterium]|nr:cell division FtsA domain-containing protein [Clostridia bacterium]
MRNESVAVLDIRSYEVTFSLGEKGVNDTFVSCGSCSERYEGYSTKGFFDEDSFRRAVIATITSVRQTHEGIINEIYVGVPAAFVSVKTKGHTISFTKKRKISAQDVDALFDSGLDELMSPQECIRRSNMYFTFGDNRKYFSEKELYGVPTNLLKGALCYYFADDQFYATVTAVLKDLGVLAVHFIPSTLAQALYLLPEKRREGYAVLLDVGFLNTSISVVYGNGIVHEETFDCGQGTILVELMEALDVDYETAQDMLASANVSGGSVPKDLFWTDEREEHSYSLQGINDVIKRGLDVLCEHIESFFLKYYREKTSALSGKSVCITGEGVVGIGGATEHISKRLNRLVEIVCPDLPYYDKPSCSSKVALMSIALSDRKKCGLFYRIFNTLGGKKK